MTPAPRRSAFAGRSDLRQRRYFELPVWADQTAEVQAQAWSAWQAWGDLRCVKARALPEGTRLAPHPLVDAYRPPAPDEPADRRRGREEAAFHQGRASFATALREPEPDGLVSFLENLARDVTGGPAALRRTPVMTDPDHRGIRVLFPRPGTLRTRVGSLQAWLGDRSGPPSFRAMVAMVAITNCHPFANGNGRLSRVVANLILNEEQAPDGAIFLPLRELGNQPPGNLTLYARDAELRGAWAGLLRFLMTAIDHAASRGLGEGAAP